MQEVGADEQRGMVDTVQAYPRGGYEAGSHNGQVELTDARVDAGRLERSEEGRRIVAGAGGLAACHQISTGEHHESGMLRL
jgi:hypothetical protein